MLCRRCLMIMKSGTRYERKKGLSMPSCRRYFECEKCHEQVYNDALNPQELLAESFNKKEEQIMQISKGVYQYETNRNT